RLRALATAAADRRIAAAAGRGLAPHSGRSANTAGTAHGPAAAGAADICRRCGGTGTGRSIDARAEGTKPAPWTDALDAGGGRLGGGAFAIVRTTGSGHGYGDRQSHTAGD